MNRKWWNHVRERLTRSWRTKRTARRPGPQLEVLEGRDLPAPVVRSAAGPTNTDTALVDAVNRFRLDLGGANNGVNGSFATGRREINWDAVPDSFSAPNALPGNFFNNNSLRGAVLTTPGSGFQLSADSDNPTNTPVEFGNLDPSYPAIFQPFSPQRLFTALNSTTTDVTFFVPNSPTVAATVSGFGAVFTDVDSASATTIQFFDQGGGNLGTFPVPVLNNGLSFLGVSFDQGERIGRVRITSGNAAPATGVLDAGPIDVVVMDDFLYGEPQPLGGRIQLSAPAINVAENAGTATFTVTRSGNLTQSTTVNFATTNGTARTGSDYVFTQGTLSFAAGESQKTISINLLDDNLPDGIKTFNVTLGGATNGAILDPQSRGVVNIIDNETPAPALIGLANTGTTLLRFNADAPGTITPVQVTGLQSGETLLGIDYRPADGQLYALGSTSRLYTVNTTTGVATAVGTATFATPLNGTEFGFDFNPTVDRLRVTSDTDQNLRLNPDNGAIAAEDSTLAYATVDSNAGQDPRVIAAAYTRNFPGTSTTTLFGIDSGRDALVIQGSAGGNPVSPNGGQLFTVGSLGVDTNDLAGFDIAPGTEGTAFASLTGPNDSASRLFTIDLDTGVASLLGAIGGTALIRDIAVVPAGIVQLSDFTYTVSEAAGQAIVTVTRGQSSEGAVSVVLTASNGTATGGVDYGAATTTVTFAAGDTAPKTVAITITEDNVSEGTETVFLTLSNPTGGAVLGRPSVAILQITDNETPPVISLSPHILVNEGNNATATAVFTASLSAAAGQSITVNFATANGTATAPGDYQPASGSVTFNPGETTKTISITVNGDTTVEGNETVLVTLSNPSGATLSPTQASGVLTIRDDDGTAVERFISSVYLQLLRRPVDLSAMTFWTTFLNQPNASRIVMVRLVQASEEYRRLVVQDMYQELLRRPADPTGLQFFVGALANGATIEGIKAFLIGSPEYFQNRGAGTNEGFLNAVYQDLLGRTPDATGRTFFLQLLGSTGGTRTTVADLILNSQEFRERFVQAQYQNILRRGADPTGLTFFVNAFRNGARDEDVIAFLFGSQEYFERFV